MITMQHTGLSGFGYSRIAQAMKTRAPTRHDANAPRLRPHPRLYITPAAIDRVRETNPFPALAEDQRIARRAARHALKVDALEYPHETHNALLVRAREVQQRTLSLLVAWLQTRRASYRNAVIHEVRSIAGWEYWSWIAMRKGDRRDHAEFDLSCGENSTTLAVAFDLLYDTLTPDEVQLFTHTARKRSLRPFLTLNDVPKPCWWFGNRGNNWNAVCAGGAGMLALALFERLPEAQRVLELAEKSIRPFMLELDKTDGAWPEGIGYWNYGMCYAYRYLLSHEQATGRAHPLLQRHGTRLTVDYPLMFSPHGVPCSFGDVNQWSPYGFHYALAARLKRLDLVARMDEQRDEMYRRGKPAQSYGGSAELLLLHPRRTGRPPAAQRSVARLYSKVEWAVLADRMPKPNLYVAVRGGTTRVSHSHLDLLSFNLVVKDEALIVNLSGGAYLDTTFGPRRWELFEMTPPSKNTILINGVGIAQDATVSSRLVTVGGYRGVSLEATQAMGQMRDGPVAEFCSRLFLILDKDAVLIVDRIEPAAYAQAESRLHTRGAVSSGKSGAVIEGERQAARVSFACDVPSTLHTTSDALTTPTGKPPTLLRWCTEGLHRRMTLATLITPGLQAARVALEWKTGTLYARLKIGERSHRLRLPRQARR